MTYLKPLIIHTDHITGRVYTYSVVMYDYPISYVKEFIMNMSRTPLSGRLLYSNHFKSSPYLEESDIEKYYLGEIVQVIDMRNMYVYETPWLRPMLQTLYDAGYSGYNLN